MRPEKFRFGFPLDLCTKDEFLLVRAPRFKEEAKRIYPAVEFDEGEYSVEDGVHVLTCKPSWRQP
jgi:hypothetical protein